jgi:hypothetical protein
MGEAGRRAIFPARYFQPPALNWVTPWFLKWTNHKEITIAKIYRVFRTRNAQKDI